MTIPQSKITAQGQISVPASIRRKLGVGPGSVLEWRAEGEDVVIRRAARFSSEELHRAVFDKRPKPRSIADLEVGVREYIKRRHARG